MSVYSRTMTTIGAARRAVPTAGLVANRTTILRLLLVAFVLGIATSVYFLRDELNPTEAGYPAIAALSFFASAGLVVPVPGMAAVCAGGVFLNPVLVALVAAVPGTVGELSGYAIGYSGRGVATKNRLYRRIEYWTKRRGWLIILLLSVLPNPIFDLAGIAAGVLRYPIWYFLGLIFLGTFIKFLLVTYGCAYGVEGILKLFGVTAP